MDPSSFANLKDTRLAVTAEGNHDSSISEGMSNSSQPSPGNIATDSPSSSSNQMNHDEHDANSGPTETPSNDANKDEDDDGASSESSSATSSSSDDNNEDEENHAVTQASNVINHRAEYSSAVPLQGTHVTSSSRRSASPEPDESQQRATNNPNHTTNNRTTNGAGTATNPSADELERSFYQAMVLVMRRQARIQVYTREDVQDMIRDEIANREASHQKEMNEMEAKLLRHQLENEKATVQSLRSQLDEARSYTDAFRKEPGHVGAVQADLETPRPNGLFKIVGSIDTGEHSRDDAHDLLQELEEERMISAGLRQQLENEVNTLEALKEEKEKQEIAATARLVHTTVLTAMLGGAGIGVFRRAYLFNPGLACQYGCSAFKGALVGFLGAGFITLTLKARGRLGGFRL